MARLAKKGIYPGVLWFCLLFHVSGIGQSKLEFQNITDEQGLPGKILTDIAQDQDGFIWGSFAGIGVARYDGHFFKLFQSEANNPNSLSYNFAQSLLIDSQQNIWIGTWKGLNLYDRKLENFTRFFSDKVTGDPIYAIFEDSQKRIWAGAGGLNLIQKTDTAFSILTYVFNDGDTTTISSDQVRGILEDEENNLWVACNNGMNLFNESTREFLRFPAPRNNMEIQTAMIDRSGQIWLGTFGQGLWQFNHHTGEYLNYWEQVQINTGHNEFVGTIRKIYEDSKGNFWIATDGSGLGQLDRYRHLLTMHMHDTFRKESLVHNNVLSLYEDAQGNLWIGTVDGISVLNARTVSIEIKSHHPLIKNGLSNNWVTDIMEDDKKNLWIATEGGINHLEPATGRFTHFNHQPGKPGLTSDKAATLIKDHEGWIWSGHWLTGVTKFHAERKQFIQYTAENPQASFLSNFNVRKIHQDRKRNYWFVNDAGVDFLNHQTNKSYHFEFTFARDLLEDRIGNIWIVGINGMGHIDYAKFQFSKISDRSICSILEDREGLIWLATDEEGVVKYDPENGQETIITQINGKTGPNCYGIVEDNNGHFWITSSRGIFVLDPSTGDTRKILSVRGSDNIKFRPYLKSSDGRIYFGTINGVISLHPDSIQDYNLPPKPVFTDFLLHNKKVLIDEHTALKTSISDTKEITLNHLQNAFTLNYVSPYFEEPAGINYAFQLEGFDKEWREVGNQKSANYTNLDPGSYEFRVKASNQNNIWTSEEATLRIMVQPPPWKTWWAYSLYGLMMFIFLLLGRRQIIQRERLKTQVRLEHMELEKIKEMDTLKTQFFANISHEFRTPLTLILGPLKQMKEGTFKGEVETVINVMIRNSQRLLRLINQLLDFSKLESGVVPLQTSVGDLVEFIRTLFASFESVAGSRGIKYVFQSDVSSVPAYYDRDKLEKAIVNLLSNAFKFTEKGGFIKLCISNKVKDPQVDKGDGIMEIRIEDNGVGIDNEKLPYVFDRFYQADYSSTRQQEGTGIGLALAKELVELHYGTIAVTSKKGWGTTFTIHLPLGRSHLNEEEMVIPKGYRPIDTSHLETLPVDTSQPMQLAAENKDLPLLLIIDDNQDMRLYLSEVLSDHYRLMEAHNGVKGWDQALENIPDLIISDVMMPGIDGYQLCHKLKTDERTSHIPVVLLTARAGESAKIEGLDTGADDYITKPFSPLELKARIQNLIELRLQLREQFSKSLSIEPKDIAITSVDERFLQRVLEVMVSHRSDPDYSTDRFARDIGMSRSQLHRKLKALTDQSAGEFIRTYRLKYACQLLEKNYDSIAQVAYESGFNNPSYFTECFKQQFGIVPSQYANLEKPPNQPK